MAARVGSWGYSMKRAGGWWLLAMGLLSNPSDAASSPLVARPLRDVNGDTVPRGSDPQVFARLGRFTVLSTAGSEDAFRNLWSTDGTAAGTRLIAAGLSLSTSDVWEAGGSVLFLARRWRNPGHGLALWGSRGTPETTGALTGESFSSSCYSRSHCDRAEASWIEPIGRWLVIAPQVEFPTWAALVSDGTRSGTATMGEFRQPAFWPTSRGALVADFPPSGGPPGPARLFELTSRGLTAIFERSGAFGKIQVLRDQAVFTLRTPNQRLELWSLAFSGSSPPRRLRRFGRQVYWLSLFGGWPSNARSFVIFEIYRAGGQRGLLHSDGTSAGTYLVAPGERPAACRWVVFSGRAACLQESFSASGQSAIWVIQGRQFQRIAEFEGAFSEVLHRQPGERRPFVFLSASTPATGRELWVTDGSKAGTHLFADFCPGVCSSGAWPFLEWRDRWVVRGRDEALRETIWTADGKGLVVRLGALAALDARLTGVFEGSIDFVAGQSGEFEVWRTHGQASDLMLVRRFTTKPFEYLASLLETPRRFLVKFESQRRGLEPGVLSVDDGEVRPLPDLARGRRGLGSAPGSFMKWRDEVLFLVPEDGLWRSDGSEAGTVRVAQFPGSGCAGSDPSITGLPGVEVAGFAIISCGAGDLWRTDGTDAGTVPDRKSVV